MKTKKVTYISLTIFLGLVLSFIAHAFFELAIIKSALSRGEIIEGTYFLGAGWCALPIWTQYSLPILGVVGGYFLGQYWWRIVYIEKRHWRFRNKNKKRKNK